MGLHITLGYDTNNRGTEPVLLFLGSNAEQAKKYFEKPPKGILRTELLSHVRATRQWKHDGSGVGFEGIEGGDELSALRLEVVSLSQCLEAERALAEESLGKQALEIEALKAEGVVSVARITELESLLSHAEAARDEANARITKDAAEKEKLGQEDEKEKSEPEARGAGREDGAGRPGNGLGQDAPATGDLKLEEAPGDAGKAAGSKTKK